MAILGARAESIHSSLCICAPHLAPAMFGKVFYMSLFYIQIDFANFHSTTIFELKWEKLVDISIVMVAYDDSVLHVPFSKATTLAAFYSNQIISFRCASATFRRLYFHDCGNIFAHVDDGRRVNHCSRIELCAICISIKGIRFKRVWMSSNDSKICIDVNFNLIFCCQIRSPTNGAHRSPDITSVFIFTPHKTDQFGRYRNWTATVVADECPIRFFSWFLHFQQWAHVYIIVHGECESMEWISGQR